MVVRGDIMLCKFKVKGFKGFDKEIVLDFKNHNEYQFNTSGIYVVEINIKKTLTTMNGMFRNCYFIYSISFLPGFDTSKVTEMGGMIFNMNVESIDMKYLDVSSLCTRFY